MREKVLHPFETIERALEFMVLLEGVISDVSSELAETAEKANTERYGNGVKQGESIVISRRQEPPYPQRSDPD